MNVLEYSDEEKAYVCPYDEELSIILRPQRNETFKIFVNDAEPTEIGILNMKRDEWTLKGRRRPWLRSIENRVKF